MSENTEWLDDLTPELRSFGTRLLTAVPADKRDDPKALVSATCNLLCDEIERLRRALEKIGECTCEGPDDCDELPQGDWCNPCIARGALAGDPQ